MVVPASLHPMERGFDESPMRKEKSGNEESAERRREEKQTGFSHPDHCSKNGKNERKQRNVTGCSGGEFMARPLVGNLFLIKFVGFPFTGIRWKISEP